MPNAIQKSMTENVPKQKRMNFTIVMPSNSNLPSRLRQEDTLTKARITARADRHPTAICKIKA